MTNLTNALHQYRENELKIKALQAENALLNEQIVAAANPNGARKFEFVHGDATLMFEQSLSITGVSPELIVKHPELATHNRGKMETILWKNLNAFGGLATVSVNAWKYKGGKV